MVALDDDTKERFDRLQEDGTTQSEFIDVLLDQYEYTDTQGMADLRIILERLEKLEDRTGAKAELGAYRGVSDALDTIDISNELRESED